MYSGVPQAKNTRLHTRRTMFLPFFGMTTYRSRLMGRNTKGKNRLLNDIVSPPYSASRKACLASTSLGLTTNST